ncbi:Protein-L-isoaspartate O-methyltransferase [hydrothermal vent metagenome]|uniref:protein-L-isoaspartate(D-aspartate) O-methyltransferase n=1 Tax=hydrothermal vent metagenome TaxID=652676 RepID=A0A3B0ZQ88_9ZZZZ
MKRASVKGSGMTSDRTRERMVEGLKKEGVSNRRVLAALKKIPRHIFVDEALASRAYVNTALPIGLGQTISQPYIVARMTEEVFNGRRLKKVLEVGTGSGYQAAILSEVVEQVYSVERIETLMKLARSRFMALGIRNIRLKHSDGHWGWPDYGPYDAIVVTAAPEEIPQELLGQLAVGGRLVIPVGGGRNQQLHIVTRTAQEYQLEIKENVTFVPLKAGNQ